MDDKVRVAGSGYAGAAEVTTTSVPQNSRGATLAVTNPMPTEYDHCMRLTKAGQPCKSPNLKGEPFCMGHARQASAA